MALTDYKASEIFGGFDISSLSDRPNEDGITTPQLKARFDYLIKNMIPLHNSLINALIVLLENGETTNGHKHNVDNLVDGTTNRLFTEVLKLKLDSIQANAEVNQNAFSSIKVGGSTGNADSKTATFEIVAGLNIVASIDPLTNKVTLNATGDISTLAVQSLLDDVGNYFNSLEVNGALQEIGAILYPSLAKTTPVDADTMLIVDTEASSVYKKITWANIKATLKTYFDTVYFNYTHPTGDGNLHVPANSTSNNNKVLKANSTAGSYSWTDLGTVANGLTAKATPIDADSIMIVDSASSNVGKKTTFTQLKAFFKTYQDTLYQAKLVSGTNIKSINGSSILGSGDLVIESGDWNTINATLSYASADSPTFVANTSVDLTSLISVGMKIKLTQTTVKYFIVTAITSTTITLYGGTDYTLANATITLPFVSSMKAPFGFPMDKSKWTIRFEEGTTEFNQASPIQNTWYNMYSISVPIGLWDIEWSGIIAVISTASKTSVRVQGTLSTNNNTESNNNLTAYQGVSGASGNLVCIASVMRKDLINLVAKTTHYLNIRTTTASADIAAITNSVANQPTIIQAVCAYL